MWTDQPAPPEYLGLILRREIYHCTAAELRRFPLADVLTDLTMLSEEGRIMQLKAQRK